MSASQCVFFMHTSVHVLLKHYCLYLCVRAMWFTLVLFDVSIRGLSPPTSTLLFDLHQSGPDHSVFVYFQRHFSFLHVSLTPAHPLPLSLLLCVCACAGLNGFCSLCRCVLVKCKKVKDVLHLYGNSVFWALFTFQEFSFDLI